MPIVDSKQFTQKTVLALAIAAASVAPSFAQESGDRSMMLEEVVVTAQKRQESLQDVPISVATMSQDHMEMRVIDDLKDIGNDIPNLYINPFNSDPTAIRLFIRGIGQNDVQITQDPSVSLYTDGVYMGTSIGAGFEGVDIERMEILRGPQGTLYGRNATGGAVNIITRRANTEALEFRQDLTTGDLGKFQSKTILNVPLGEQFAAKLNYVKSERDGYVENNNPVGEDFGLEDRESLVVDLRWELNQDIIIDYRYEDAENHDSQRLQQVRELSPGLLSPFTTFTDDISMDFLDGVTAIREIGTNDQTIDAHSLWVEWVLNDDLTLRSITSYRELDSFTSSDALSIAEGDYTIFGGGVGAANTGVFQTDFEQTSQELQLLGNTDHWEYVVGLYYYADEATQDASASTNIGVSGRTDLTETENESIAAYTQATWHPAGLDRWHITFGARYSQDDRKADRINHNAFIPFAGSYDRDFSNFNPSLTVAFDINDDMNLYGKVVSGYKSGGTSTRSANAELFASGFDEEDILSYEVGYKGDLWGGRARLNGAIFYMELDGLQTSVQTDPISPAGRDFLPIDDNEVTGFEVDLTLLLSEGLTFTASYGYLDTELGTDTIDSGTSAGTYDLIGEFAPAPENSYSLALDYRRTLAMGELAANINYGWIDDVNTSVNVADNTVIDDYGLLGAALSWSDIKLGDAPGSLRVLLWGRNLTDEEYGLVNTAAWSVFGASDVQTFGDPRTYGVTLTYIY
jgi:iron complex outermembrane recepter protein